MKEDNKKYNIQQEVLYSVCLTAWDLCAQNREKFAGLKGYYTEAFIADAIESVKKARQLMSLCQTKSELKIARIRLAVAARRVMDNWQVLKLYITEAYDNDLVNTMLVGAGASIYKKAALYNWSAVRNLVHEATVFIEEHKETLSANNNMPEDFQIQFEADGDKCLEQSTQFFSLSLDKERTTFLKIAANNAIYASAIQMLKDGQQIFRYDETLRNQFIFSYLVSIQRGEGSASLKGYITNELNQPIEGVTIFSQNQKYMATTNSKGYYRISQVAEGTYTFNITNQGYYPIDQVITFAAGTASQGNFIMKKQMQMVA